MQSPLKLLNKRLMLIYTSRLSIKETYINHKIYSVVFLTSRKKSHLFCTQGIVELTKSYKALRI